MNNDNDLWWVYIDFLKLKMRVNKDDTFYINGHKRGMGIIEYCWYGKFISEYKNK
jgi:hypothetical protein